MDIFYEKVIEVKTSLDLKIWLMMLEPYWITSYQLL